MATRTTKMPDHIAAMTHEQVVERIREVQATQAKVAKEQRERTTELSHLKERLARIALCSDPKENPLTSPAVDAKR